MPIRIWSSALILLLGMWAAGNANTPTPSFAELRSPSSAWKKLGAFYEPSEKVCEISSPAVYESSGLVRSAREPDLLWTHNDSGGEPMIVAFDRQGKLRAQVKILGAANRDWEELTSFRMDGENWMIAADVGNNFYDPAPRELYFFREPAIDAVEVDCEHVLRFTYESGPVNCEAIAVDEIRRVILLVSKVASGRCEVFELPLQALGSPETQVAKRIASPHLTLATGMCLSADGTRAVVVNYVEGFEFCRTPSESWQVAFSRTPRPITLSWRMPQREAVCFDTDDCSLLMTSEAQQGLLQTLLGKEPRLTMPLWRVPAKAISKAAPYQE